MSVAPKSPLPSGPPTEKPELTLLEHAQLMQKALLVIEGTCMDPDERRADFFAGDQMTTCIDCGYHTELYDAGCCPAQRMTTMKLCNEDHDEVCFEGNDTQTALSAR